MKIPLAILAAVALAFLMLLQFGPRPSPETLPQRSDLPWQIEVTADGNSRVFDLELGRAVLADAVEKLGNVEGMALFEPTQGPLALEAYFGDVQFGPLKAKVIAALDGDTADLERLRAASQKREGSPSGDWKYLLRDGAEAHLHRPLKSLSYIPGTRKLDEAFFRERFGEPAAWRREHEHAVSWFYPQLGLSILIDQRRHEVLEYQPPRSFVLPPDAQKTVRPQ